MKCPLRLIASCSLPESEGSLDPECQEEYCAWWLDDIRICAIKDLALELRHTQFRLQDIVNKEVTECQSKD